MQDRGAYTGHFGGKIKYFTAVKHAKSPWKILPGTGRSKRRKTAVQAGFGQNSAHVLHFFYSTKIPVSDCVFFHKMKKAH